ncbi:MAG: hypothetical protein O3C43_01815 [Verrucomicrobia bacterium]|nr:hypothetical protein [Verrucomicrobiota bacterium]MDA1065218.1 hypothetical protein [Verrucomicrobiota bacterium]
MTQTKLSSVVIAAAALFYSGCSTTKTENAVVAPPAPSVVSTPEPEVVPEPEIVEVVELIPEPEIKVEVALPEVQMVIPAVPKPLTILGFIKYIELEGGFFGIMTESGSKYFPDYLDPDFKVDGLSVRVQATPQEQILGIQMWGTPIEIIKIESN